MLAFLIASLYLWSNRLFRIVQGGSQALFEGFWMGLLPESVYDAISEKSYGDGGLYTSDRHVDRGFYFWENLSIQAHFKTGARVLVGAAGGGRELIALERNGFQAVGFECSRAMVEAGQRALAERHLTATLIWAPPSVAPEMGDFFDALIVGWNGYCYISPRARRIEFMKNLRSQLRPESPVLVSTAIRTPGKSAAWTSRIANAVRICTFRSPVFETGDSFAGRPKMRFTRRQLERELEEAGFSVTAFYTWGDSGAVVAKSRA